MDCWGYLERLWVALQIFLNLLPSHITDFLHSIFYFYIHCLLIMYNIRTVTYSYVICFKKDFKSFLFSKFSKILHSFLKILSKFAQNFFNISLNFAHGLLNMKILPKFFRKYCKNFRSVPRVILQIGLKVSPKFLLKFCLDFLKFLSMFS